MAFTTRWVCKPSHTYDYEAVKKLLMTNGSGSKNGKHYKLSHMVRLDPEITADKVKYLPGRLYFQREIEVSDYEIENGGLKKVDSAYRITRERDFWLDSKQGIVIFRKNDDDGLYGKGILSEILFKAPDRINSLKYGIEKIEGDVISGKRRGVWSISFKDRLGNIHSGTMHGENINIDPIYDETKGTPRGLIGIMHPVNGGDIKIKIFRKGSIMFFANLEEQTNIPAIFKAIGDLNEYSYIDSDVA